MATAADHAAFGVSSSDSDDSSGAESWIEWFCRQEGNEFFCEVDRRYIEDNFNLYGLRETVPHFRTCLDIILDRADADHFDSEHGIEKHVQDLYGLAHARFLLTKRGQEKMYRKFNNSEFGVCPLLCCQGQPVLPVGLKDQLDLQGVMVYCPRCAEVMLPSMKTGGRYADDLELDGAYFGTTFPHLFLMQHPKLAPPAPVKMKKYEPRVFGFRVRKEPIPKDAGTATAGPAGMKPGTIPGNAAAKAAAAVSIAAAAAQDAGNGSMAAVAPQPSA